jgi:RHS repeat-associated protein
MTGSKDRSRPQNRLRDQSTSPQTYFHLDLYYLRARFYSPQLQRFISEDPIGVAGGPNFYGYANGDPVSLNDPLGLCPPERQKPTLCDHRTWHNLNLADKVAALQLAGMQVATGVAIHLVSANSSSFAAATISPPCPSPTSIAPARSRPVMHPCRRGSRQTTLTVTYRSSEITASRSIWSRAK